MNNNGSTQLDTLPIGKLLRQYAFPAIVGTLVIQLYNIIDRIFIGQAVGADAISGLALTFPLMSLSAAFGMLVGAGGAARISIVLGRKDIVWAEKILGNSLIMILILAISYSAVTFYFLDDLLMAFGGSERTVPYAARYLRIIIPCMVLSNLMYSFNNMMRASGYPKKAMTTMLIGAAANLILDPIFIFGLDMGIEGAAIATDISLLISAGFVMFHFIRPDSYIRFRRHSFHLEWRIIRNITSIGLSPFLINITASAVQVIINTSLQEYGGDIAIGAFGIINSFTMLIVMIIVGLCQGMQPIVGYNYGSGQYNRMQHAYKLTALTAVGITSIGFIIAQIFPEAISRAFTTDDNLIEVAGRGMRLVLFAFPIVGFQIVTTNFFQSIGKAPAAIFLSLSRQVLFLIPLLIIFPQFWELNGVWIASPVSDTISTIVAVGILWYHRKLFTGKIAKIES